MTQKDKISPGRILEEKFMKPMGLDRKQLAADLRLSESQTDELLEGRRAFSADIALRLGKYLGNAPEFWLTLQMKHDIAAAAAFLSEELEGIPQLADVPEISLKEALDVRSQEELLKQKKIRDAWVDEHRNHWFMRDALRLLENADLDSPADDIAAAAVTACDMEAIKKLTKAGYKRWNKPETGINVFNSPCLDIIEFLVENGYDVNTVYPGIFMTPLCEAARKGHADVVRYLISAGADVNFKNKQGLTPLHFSADSHCLETVKALIDAGADINARTIPNRMRDCDPDAMSVLYVMARNGFLEGLRYLVECGAELHHPKEAMTLLHGVCLGGHTPGKIRETTEYLLDLGFDPFAMDIYKATPAERAVSANNIPALQGLISRNVPLDKTHKGGFHDKLLFVEIAALNNNSSEEQLIETLELISSRSKPLAETHVLNCALVCEREERSKVCRYLLEKGCPVNSSWKPAAMIGKEWYFSPLHAICSSGNRKRTESISMLLAAGADIHQKDQNGFTPLAAALRHPLYELPEIIALFQHYGADFNAKNKAGRSILQIAERNFAEPEIIELLKKAGAK